MSKIFKSAVSHREVRIWRTSEGFAVAVLDDVSNEALSTQLAPADAPALALAILEAAGITPTAHDSYASTDHERTLEDAAWEIRRVVNARAREAERVAKEAADREAFEHARRVMDCRRNNLAIDLTKNRHASYEFSSPSLKSAIDRVIELEDQATK